MMNLYAMWGVMGEEKRESSWKMVWPSIMIRNLMQNDEKLKTVL
jgi:hypothetical protein